MALTLAELFHALASFEPLRAPMKDAPWEDYVEWAIGQGLAPLAAYNLEYKLGNSGVPTWARDRLWGIYQGSVNDTVMKLVNFKRAVGELQGRKVVLLGGGSYSDSLYPHVAFRPVVELSLLVPKADLDGFAGYLGRADFKPSPEEASRADRVLSDGRTVISLHGGVTGVGSEDEGLLMRALPHKVYGPSMRRLDLEDALLTHAVFLARAGFDVPMVELVDLRELVLGAPSMGGPYSRPVDATSLLLRAKAWKQERALWCALSLVERLFPEAEAQVRPLKPALVMPVRELLERLVVQPVAQVGRRSELKLEERLRTLLAGG